MQAVSQSGFSPKRMQMASMTCFTAAGGARKFLISVMSDFLTLMLARSGVMIYERSCSSSTVRMDALLMDLFMRGFAALTFALWARWVLALRLAVLFR